MDENTQTADDNSVAPADIAPVIDQSAGEDAPVDSGDRPFNAPEPETDVTPDEEPAAPDEPASDPEQAPEDAPEPKMTRAERAAYYRELSQANSKQVEQAIDHAYQPQPVDELKEAYLDQGYSDAEATLLARDEVRSQREQIQEARADIAELNMTLTTEAMEVVNTIAWTNAQNAETYDRETTEAASRLYEQLAVSKDPRTGQIVEAKLTPKQFYGLIDQIRSSGAAEAQLKGQKAAEQQLSAVAPPTSNTNQRSVAFNNMSVAQQEQYLKAKGHEF